MIKAIITFIILFTIDNLIVIFFPIQPLFGNYSVTPHVLLIGVCLYSFYDEKNQAPWLALAFGLVYDMYSANLLGLYATMFPIIVILIKKHIVPTTPVNFVSIFYVSAVAILAVETIIYIFVIAVEMIMYIFAMVITTRALSIFGFIQYRLIITLIFNTLLLAIVYLPLVKILKPKEEKKVKTIMRDNTSA